MNISGHIVNHDEEFDGTIVINSQGVIESVSKTQSASDIDTKNCLIFPGFTDLHVHAREDASGLENYKEDFKTASQAALHGGVTQFAEMPNNPIPLVDDAGYATKEKLAQAHGSVPILLYAGIGQTSKPLSRKVPYKIYMGPSVGALGFKSLEDVEAAVARYEGQAITFHCDDPAVLENSKNQPLHELRRPAEAEANAVDFALKLIAKYNLSGKLCHISTKKSVEMIRAAKIHGSTVTAEAAPHHMFFDVPMLTDLNRPWLQINPPVRDHEDRLAVIEGLKDGTLDYLATDHSPQTKQDKEKGASGMPHLDTYGPFTTLLMKEQGFTAKDIARVCSYNPGNYFNQFTDKKFGKIAEGYAGSLTIIDMNKPIKIEAKNLKTKCGWSPFEGLSFPGSVKYTVSLGKIYQ